MSSRTDNTKVNLTSAEMGKLWATYTSNTMAKLVLRYFLQHMDDKDIKKVVGNALDLSETIVQEIKEIFIKENFPLPIGFTDKDVNVEAPRLFSDEFYLHYLKYTVKAGMSIYSIAIPLMTRKDIRKLFITILNATVKLTTEINDVLEEKGLGAHPPTIPLPQTVDYVKKQTYLNGFIGDTRSLHALEIAHLYDNVENDVTSKGLLIGFSQVAKTEKVQKFMLRGKEITSKHIESSSKKLNKENLPSLPLLDDMVSTSTIPPFSDKLMLWHKIEMFSMKVRTYANGLSLNGRRDIGVMYGKFLADVGVYVEDGANIMIDNAWMEQPPAAVNRENIAKNKTH